MGRRRLSQPLLAGLGLLLALPAVYLLQWMVHPPQRPVLVGELAVRLDGEALGRWSARLARLPGDPRRWRGEAPISAPTFPWPPTDLGGILVLELPDPAVGGEPARWRASWTERRRRGPLPGGPTIPCAGSLRPLDDTLPPTRGGFEVALACSSAGPDLRWDTGDEHDWVLEGRFSAIRTGSGVPAALTPGVASR